MSEQQAGTGTDETAPDQAEQEADQGADQGAEQEAEQEAGEAVEQFADKPADDEIAEIEAERDERLSADNRPDGAEVDNTDREFDAQKGMFTDAEGYDEAEVVFPPVEEQAT